MTWSVGTSRGTRHNRRVAGGGTWGSQGRRLRQHEQHNLRRQMGLGGWGSQNRRMYLAQRRRERNGQWRAKVRRSFLTVVTAALILGAVLLFSPAARATGMLILFAGAVLYVITRRKKRA